jgi:hypothetical protein
MQIFGLMMISSLPGFTLHELTFEDTFSTFSSSSRSCISHGTWTSQLEGSMSIHLGLHRDFISLSNSLVKVLLIPFLPPAIQETFELLPLVVLIR